jgi:hypothetical protein
VSEHDETLAHLRVCGACRAKWLREDPTRVFALLASAPVPEPVLRSVSRQVSAAIDRPVRRSEPVAPIAFPGVAAAAAALILALATGWLALAPSNLSRPVAGQAAPPHADVELISSPGEGRVVDLTVGDTQVVMIFDPRLEL